MTIHRRPPQDETAEMAALGAMMLSPNAIGDVIEHLAGPSDFYQPKHETIYHTILDLYGAGHATDAVTVANHLHKTGNLAKTGGASYLHDLLAAAPTTENAGYYARIIADHATARHLINAATRIHQLGYAAQGDAATMLDLAQSEILAIKPPGATTGPSHLNHILLNEMPHHDTQKTGLATGFTDLDQLTGGLQPGQLIVIAGRPGIGKSTLGLDIARNTATNGTTTLICTLEMTRIEIAQRILAAHTQTRLTNIRTNNLTEKEQTRITQATQNLATTPLHIGDTPTTNPTTIRAAARRLKKHANFGLIVIDYLQLMTSPRRHETRQTEVAEYSRSLKLLAKELDLPVIALSQLNRGPEQRSDKKPQLSDLRESGAIEQDADLVILLHREDIQDPTTPRIGEADLIIAKNRNGPTKTIPVAFQGHYARHSNLAT